MHKPWEATNDPSHDQRRAATVLDVGGMHNGMDKLAASVGENVTLAALDLHACDIAVDTAAFCGLTLRLSMAPAIGLASRPSASRIVTSK